MYICYSLTFVKFFFNNCKFSFLILKVLKRQVQSLTMHQKKLETELQQLEEKYNTKKRQLQETSDEFGKELKKHCDQPVNDDKFKEMINEQVNGKRNSHLSKLTFISTNWRRANSSNNIQKNRDKESKISTQVLKVYPVKCIERRKNVFKLVIKVYISVIKLIECRRPKAIK